MFVFLNEAGENVADEDEDEDDYNRETDKLQTIAT